MNINVEAYLPQSILTELRKALLSIPKGRSLRLVRIPVMDFSSAIEKVVKFNPYMPFRPVIFNNIPIDMTENAVPECILVADDNTNIERTSLKEIELFKGE